MILSGARTNVDASRGQNLVDRGSSAQHDAKMHSSYVCSNTYFTQTLSETQTDNFTRQGERVVYING